MRTLKSDLVAANKRLEQQSTAMELALYDLVVRPETVIWISAGKPGSETFVRWGLIRIAGAMGGYVLRRYGREHLSPIETLDNLREKLPDTLASRVASSNPEARTLAENERQVMTQALATRTRALETEAAKRGG